MKQLLHCLTFTKFKAKQLLLLFIKMLYCYEISVKIPIVLRVTHLGIVNNYYYSLSKWARYFSTGPACFSQSNLGAKMKQTEITPYGDQQALHTFVTGR